MDQINQKTQQDISQVFLNPQYTLPAAFACLGLASFKFYRSMKTMFLMKYLKQKFKMIKPVTEIPKGKSDAYDLGYISGKLKFDKDTNLYDYHFGIKPVNQDSIGILRKVELYQTSFLQSSGQFIDQRDQSYFQIMINKNSQNKLLQSQVFTKGKLTIDNYTLSGSLFEDQSTENMNKINIHQDEIKNYIEQTFRLNFNEEEKEKQEKDQLIKEGIHNQESHPYRQLNKRHLIHDNNYIYFQKTPNQFSKGDIRISFYEIKKLDEITVIAGLKNDVLDPVELNIPRFSKFRRNILLGNKVHVFKPTQVKYVVEGLIPMQDLVNNITYQLQQDDRFYKIFYFVLIYLLYNFIESQLATTPESASIIPASYYVQFKKYIGYEGIQQIFNFEKSLKILVDDSKLSVALHYGATYVLISLGLPMTCLVSSLYFIRRNKLDEEENQKQIQNEENITKN